MQSQDPSKLFQFQQVCCCLLALPLGPSDSAARHVRLRVVLRPACGPLAIPRANHRVPPRHCLAPKPAAHCSFWRGWQGTGQPGGGRPQRWEQSAAWGRIERRYGAQVLASARTGSCVHTRAGMVHSRKTRAAARCTGCRGCAHAHDAGRVCKVTGREHATHTHPAIAQRSCAPCQAAWHGARQTPTLSLSPR